MNLENALNIFNWDGSVLPLINKHMLKSRYYKLALKYHPDKNSGNKEAEEKFKELKDAYDFLLLYIQCKTEDDTDTEDLNINIYNSILLSFITNIFQNHNYFIKIVKELVIQCNKKIAIQLINQLELEQIITMYNFLYQHIDILHIDKEIINEVIDIIKNKYQNIECYRLNPSIKDLLEGNLYKLHYEDTYFVVPLWHNEVQYNHKSKIIIIFCKPELSSNISIDEEGNLIVKKNILFDTLKKSMIDNIDLEIEIIPGLIEKIKVQDLRCKKYQRIILKNKGIINIKDDLYDHSEKSNMIIDLTIET